MGTRIKILLLADSNSAHTIKWAKALAQHPMDILLLGLAELSHTQFDGIENLSVRSLHQLIDYKHQALSKIKYLKALPVVKQCVREFKPDIVHAHYATSYGLLGALSGFHPLIISVWGSDIYEFPTTSFLHKRLLQYNLGKADKILSTSQSMAKETALYTNKNIDITPFGIDTDIFKPQKTKTIFHPNDIVIGTIKSLEPVYGIDRLIDVFHNLVQKHPKLPLKLMIVGSGSLEHSLKQQAQDLGIQNRTTFIHHVPHAQVVDYYNMLSIFVALSRSESFGVSVIEAGACEVPVVVSNVGGLPEVVEDQVNGFVVDGTMPQAAELAIEKLILDTDLRQTMGKRGRQRVQQYYNWQDNVKQMMEIYNETI